MTAPAALALVMELVDGEDLSARIARAALDEALPIARAVRRSSSAAVGAVGRPRRPARQF